MKSYNFIDTWGTKTVCVSNTSTLIMFVWYLSILWVDPTDARWCSTNTCKAPRMRNDFGFVSAVWLRAVINNTASSGPRRTTVICRQSANTSTVYSSRKRALGVVVATSETHGYDVRTRTCNTCTLSYWSKKTRRQATRDVWPHLQ